MYTFARRLAASSCRQELLPIPYATEYLTLAFSVFTMLNGVAMNRSLPCAFTTLTLK